MRENSFVEYLRTVLLRTFIPENSSQEGPIFIPIVGTSIITKTFNIGN